MSPNASLTEEEKLRIIRPVSYVGNTYYGWDGHSIGRPEELMKSLSGLTK